MNPFALIGRVYRNMGLRRRLILTFFVMALVLVLIISLYSYAKVSSTIRHEATLTSRQLISGLANSIEYRLSGIHRVGEQVASSTAVQKIVNQSRDYYPLGEQIKDCRDAVEYLTFMQDSNEVYRVRVFVPAGVIYSKENGNIFSLESVTGSDWCGVLLRERPPYLFYAQSTYYVWNNVQQVVSCAVPLWSYDSKRLAGIVSVDVQLSHIRELLGTNATSLDTTILLLGSDGQPIIGSGPEVSPFLLERLNRSAKDGEWITTPERKEYFEYRQQVSGTQWYLGYVLPAGKVLGGSMQFRSELTALLVIVMALAFLLAIAGSRINTRRIMQLAQRMKEVQAGDLSVSAKVHSHDEIGGLERGFNFLMQSVSELIETHTQARDQLREAELRLLHSQIQPHFLYNTLDLINWRVLRLGDRDTSNIILELSKFYKISLSHGRELIPIGEELEHAKLYVSIQNHRYGNAVRLSVCVDDGILGLLIHKVTLQPLLENAILHGLQEKTPEGTGSIWIKGRRDEDCVTIEVCDDGRGMSDEDLKAILDENRDRHYGIWNIHQRFQLTFGPQYGLSYFRNEPAGVRVVIRFPVLGGENRLAQRARAAL